MADPDPDTIARLTRAELARRVGAIVEQRRQATMRAAELYATKGPRPVTVSPRIANVREATRRLLNGAHSLMPDPPAEEEPEDLELAIEAMDAALKILSDADVEAQAIDDARWALAHQEAWSKLVARWLERAQALAEAEAEARAWLDRQDERRRNSLPLTAFIGVSGATVANALGGRTPLADVLAAAKVEGIKVRAS
ncbi:MAG TPA: hypothetical protein VN806_13125 [Caulobacteraceae bacterium]|nr:hypothetical protein [Caulobacteraceae bacterium]